MQRSDEVETYTIEQVAKILGIGRNQAYEAARRGDFPTMRFGSRWVIPKARFDSFLRGEFPSGSAKAKSEAA